MATKLKTVEEELHAMDASATLASAMALAFAEIESATKGALNPHFKSKYADLGAVIEAIKPALIAHRLFFTQHPQPSPDGVTVETVLHHASGESLSMGALYVPANKRDPQGFGSALTYARRYALQTAFGVPTEDDDGNAAVAAMKTAPVVDYALPAKLKDEIETLAPKAGKTVPALCGAFSVEDLSDLSVEQANKCIARLRELIEAT